MNKKNMAGIFKFRTLRKKLVAWFLLISLLPMLVMVMINLNFQAGKLRQGISERLEDNREGLRIELEEKVERLLDQTERTAAQPILLGAVSAGNQETLERLLTAYLKLNQSDRFGVYGKNGDSILTLQKVKARQASLRGSIPQNNRTADSSLSYGFGSLAFAQEVFDSQESEENEDDFSFDDVEVEAAAVETEEGSDLSFGEEIESPSVILQEGIRRAEAPSLSRDFLSQLRSSGRGVAQIKHDDGMMIAT